MEEFTDRDAPASRAAPGWPFVFAWSSLVLQVIALLISQWVLQADRPFNFPIETRSIAAAVSRAFHNVPGLLSLAEVQTILDHPGLGLNEKIRIAASATPQTPDRVILQSDGNETGYIRFLSAAMTLFGPSNDSFGILFFSLMVLSIALAAFDLRLDCPGLVAISVAVTAVTIVLGEWLFQYDQQVYAAFAIRSMPALAAVPAVYIGWLVASQKSVTPARAAIVIVQSFILAIAILSRRAAFEYVLALCIVTFVSTVWILVRSRSLTTGLRGWLWPSILLAVFLLVNAFHSMDRSERYSLESSLADSIWHRPYISLGVHPKFPFDKDVNCLSPIPGTPGRTPEQRHLLPGIVDFNGQCAYLYYRQKNGFGYPQEYHWLLWPDYEKTMRQVLMDTISRYPEYVLEAVGYKIKSNLSTLWSQALKTSFPSRSIPASVAIVIGLAAAVLALFMSAQWRSLGWGLLVYSSAFIATFVPLLYAWPARHTIRDLAVAAIGLALCACLLALTAAFKLGKRLALGSRVHLSQL